MVSRMCFDTEPNKNFLQGNSERFTAIITESFETLELKFEDILKIQGEQRYGCCFLVLLSQTL